LNKARKRRAREEERKQADLNRVVFGRTKAERTAVKVERDTLNKKLDSHSLAGDDVS
jgi:hypothetical protein